MNTSKTSNTTTMTKEELINLVRMDTSGKFFTVEFIKRTTGQLRTMNCRKGVRKGVKGIGLSFNPSEIGLMVVWSPNKGFRMINLEELRSVSIHGTKHILDK